MLLEVLWNGGEVAGGVAEVAEEVPHVRGRGVATGEKTGARRTACRHDNLHIVQRTGVQPPTERR